MLIRKLEYNDIEKMCFIHSSTFDKAHFSTLFSKEMLFEYYRLLLEYNEFCIGIENENRDLAAYLICGKDYNKAISKFVDLYSIKILSLIIKNPRFLYEKFLDFFFEVIKKKSEESYIIYILATDPAMKRKGFGKLLYKKIEQVLLEKGITKFGLYVRKRNFESILFHENNNFNRISSNYKNYFFTKELKISASSEGN